jgi:hypothetical protein
MKGLHNADGTAITFDPTYKLEQGAQILDAIEGLSLRPSYQGYLASVGYDQDCIQVSGPTKWIAAMRLVLKIKFGEMVEVPWELI